MSDERRGCEPADMSRQKGVGIGTQCPIKRKAAIGSQLMERRSRHSRDSAGRREPTTSASRPIHRSEGVRTQFYAARKIVGIAPNSLLFHAGVKKEGISPATTKEREQSAALTKQVWCVATPSATMPTQISAVGTVRAMRRQGLTTYRAIKSSYDKGEGA